MKQHLSARWRRLWSTMNVPTSVSGYAFDRLYESYTDKSRGYHGIEHIAHCLNVFDEVQFLAEHPREVEAAIWWHDVVYNPRAKDNELQSQHYAYAECTLARMPSLFAERVGELIMATTHTTEVAGNDEQLICDIDLSSLGTPDWDTMCSNSRGIRKELRHLAEAEYIAKRSARLEDFRTRERLYYTPYFSARFLAQARENLAREIAILPELAKLTD